MVLQEPQCERRCNRVPSTIAPIWWDGRQIVSPPALAPRRVGLAAVKMTLSRRQYHPSIGGTTGKPGVGAQAPPSAIAAQYEVGQQIGNRPVSHASCGAATANSPRTASAER